MKIAWFDDKVLPSAMLNSGFKSLEKSDHFPVLRKCFDIVEGSKLLDLGCGKAEAARVFNKYQYTGADLPHIIEGVAKKNMPNSNFVCFNAQCDNLEFVGSYDIVLMNGFISELPNWYEVLSKVLHYAAKFVILHRQKVTSNPSRLETYRTYGNLTTAQSVVNCSHLRKLFLMNKYEILFEETSYPHQSIQRTFLLKRNEALW